MRLFELAKDCYKQKLIGQYSTLSISAVFVTSQEEWFSGHRKNNRSWRTWSSCPSFHSSRSLRLPAICSSSRDNRGYHGPSRSSLDYKRCNNITSSFRKFSSNTTVNGTMKKLNPKAIIKKTLCLLQRLSNL